MVGLFQDSSVRYRALPMASQNRTTTGNSLRVAGLFAGIGGIEIGLHDAGHQTNFLCEIDEEARAVLDAWYAKQGVRLDKDVPFERDVLKAAKKRLPEGIDLVAGGFPCQDLSQAGKTAGIGGKRSGLAEAMLATVERVPKTKRPRWILIENVSFMLRLDKGAAMTYLVGRLEELGYSWAYRLVDTRSFGLPQRRQRVILLAGREEDPREVLFADERGAAPSDEEEGKAIGFYWTEGTRGLGWAPNTIPTLKGGSGVGIPSPPAIWLTDGRFVTPNIVSAERLQGFPVGHTEAARRVDARKGERARWRLLGNAVSVGVAKWVGRRLREPGTYRREHTPLTNGWPVAAFGRPGEDAQRVVDVGMFPLKRKLPDLEDFLHYRGALQANLLSHRAMNGFCSRYVSDKCNLGFRPVFYEAMSKYLKEHDGRPLADYVIPRPSAARKRRRANVGR